MSIQYKTIDCPMKSTTYMGMGSYIGFMSLLISTNKSYQINMHNADIQHPGFALKQIFNISDDVIKIKNFNVKVNLDETVTRGLHDLAKIYSRYLTSTHINLFNTKFKKKTNDKKTAIGLVITGHSEVTSNIYNGQPNSNLHPKISDITKNEIDMIVGLAIKSGYDIILFESYQSSLEHKVFMLNELCDCVIGYEGGIMHLAHCLDIPTIIFPWSNKNSDVKPFIFPEFNPSVPMIMHLDKRAYFLESLEELKTWDSSTLIRMIDRLKSEGGNNQLLLPSFGEKMKTLPTNEQHAALIVPPLVRDFIKDIKNPSLGGY